MPTASGKPSMMDAIIEGKVPTFFAQGDFHEPYFCMGTGQWIKSKQQRRQIMKDRNLIEMGNECPAEIKEQINKMNNPKKDDHDR